MIEVTCFTTGPKEFSNSAEADTPEAARLAARTLWDEGYSGWSACRRRLVFRNEDGEVIWAMEHCP